MQFNKKIDISQDLYQRRKTSGGVWRDPRKSFEGAIKRQPRALLQVWKEGGEGGGGGHFTPFLAFYKRQEQHNFGGQKQYRGKVNRYLSNVSDNATVYSLS